MDIITTYNTTVESLSLYDRQESGELCKKKNVDWDQNQYVAMASEISNGDQWFVAKLDSENGLWTHDRKHIVSYWRDGAWVKGKWMPAGWYDDWGFCGTSDFYHWDIVEDDRFFSDPYWQLEQCYALYSGGTTMYGNSAATYDNFTCQ